MPLIGFTEAKAKMILEHDIKTRIRQSKCTEKLCMNNPKSIEYDEKFRGIYPGCMRYGRCYKPRIKPGDVVKLYVGLRQRKYCKHLLSEGKLCNEKSTMLIKCPPDTKNCGNRGARHFETWNIEEIRTIKFEDLTETIAFNDGFWHRPWSKSEGCDGCLSRKFCKLQCKDAGPDAGVYWEGLKCRGLYQLRLFLKSAYNAKDGDLFDIIRGEKRD